MNYFIKGLDLGGMQEPDFTGDVKLAFTDLATISTMQEKLSELFEREHVLKESDIAETRKQVIQLEDVMFHCLARINVGLRKARMAETRETSGRGAMGQKPTPASSGKIHGNQFCPCGSGKKYKKCCGLTH